MIPFFCCIGYYYLVAVIMGNKSGKHTAVMSLSQQAPRHSVLSPQLTAPAAAPVATPTKPVDASSCLIDAIRGDQDDVVYSIINRCVVDGMTVDNVDKKGKTALAWAAYEGKILYVEALIKAGASVHNINNSRISIMMEACIFGRDVSLCIVEVLIKNKADITVVNKYGNSAIVYAVNRGSYDCVKLLLSHGALMHDTKRKKSLMELATGNGYDDCMKLLLDNGYIISVNEGYSLLTHAIKAGYSECVKVLICAGVSTSVPVTTYEPPFNTAVDCKQYKCLEYIVDVMPMRVLEDHYRSKHMKKIVCSKVHNILVTRIRKNIVAVLSGTASCDNTTPQQLLPLPTAGGHIVLYSYIAAYCC